MKQNSESRKKSLLPQIKRAGRYDLDLRPQLIFAVIEAIILLGLCVGLYIVPIIKSGHIKLYAAILILAFYVLTSGIVCLFFSIKYKKIKDARSTADRCDTEIYDIFRYTIDIPYALVGNDGVVRVMNGALQDILGYKKALYGVDFSEVCPLQITDLASKTSNRGIYHSGPILDRPEKLPLEDMPVVRLADGKRYSVTAYAMQIQQKEYYFVLFTDVNEYLEFKEETEREATVVAYITIDNLQELTQYVRADYRNAVTEIERMLEGWVSEMQGFIREYERNKYVATFPKKELDRQIENEFAIQQKIMDLKIGDSTFPVTISMGISAQGDTLEQKEKFAGGALSMAISRGGNQVAIKNDESYIFFGGTHKTIESNTSVVSRVSAKLLYNYIERSSNIIIMGHSNPDYDCIGACVGIARYCMSCSDEIFETQSKPSIHIVMDKSSESFMTCMKHLEGMAEYENMFVGKDAAPELVMSDTLLIITDVNNPKIYECPDLSRTVKNIALIDHHRLGEQLDFTPFLQYIETTRSSASEIVSEILFQSKFAEQLTKEEATLLLGGIMLDTQNFTRNTGAQTFALTHYLYTRGAHTEVTRDMFRDEMEEILLMGAFESNAHIYGRDRNIAISWMADDGTGEGVDRTIAAKVADKLVSAKGIDASFALLRIGDDVVISGRSTGKVNVQLILERLKGGGHFNMAGAQIRGSSITNAKELLLGAIDDYYRYDCKS